MEKSELRLLIEEEIEKLLEISENYIAKDIGLHEMEKGILKQLLNLGLVLLEYIIKRKLTQLNNYRIELGAYKKTGTKSRNYLSLFGKLKIVRPSYWSKEKGQFFKLDEILKLPRDNYWSYNIQKMVGTNSTETDFRESIRLLNDLLDLGLSGKGSQRNVDRLGCHVEEFYDLTSYQCEEEGEHFMCSFDGKGVPKIKPALSIRGNPKERLSRGEKRGIKQMATVSVIASFTAKQSKQRGFESILLGLMGQEEPMYSLKKEEGLSIKSSKPIKQTDNKMYKNIHRRGFLADQEKAIEYGILELKARMKDSKSRFVVPIDAGIGLEKKVLSCIKKHQLKSKFAGIVLDIVHVSEYVWEAGTAIFGEHSKFRRTWVRNTLEMLLKGNVGKVIEELKLHRDKTNLTKNKKKQLDTTITYFTNHQHKMNYDWFLKKGYPISSSIVESTCKHLIKDRMEQSGMRWSSQGAQDMMDLRAVKINGDINELMDFVIKKDRKVCITKIAA